MNNGPASLFVKQNDIVGYEITFTDINTDTALSNVVLSDTVTASDNVVLVARELQDALMPATRAR